jgi:hypothetical protein
MSVASGKGLSSTLAKIDLPELPTLCTLTYGDSYPLDPSVVKSHLNHFLTLLRKYCPDAWGVWRAEFQQRGAPHFHLLLWGLPSMVAVRSRARGAQASLVNARTYLRLVWLRILGRTHCRKCQAHAVDFVDCYSFAGSEWYLRLHHLKRNQTPEKEFGRWWGVVNYDGLRAHQTVTAGGVGEGKNLHALRRILVRWAKSRWGRNWRKSKYIKYLRFGSGALWKRKKGVPGGGPNAWFVRSNWQRVQLFMTEAESFRLLKWTGFIVPENCQRPINLTNSA